MPIKIDDTDRRILDLIQNDSSPSTADVAKQVGLSMSPCWRRIRRLEDLGVIRKRVALLDREKLGLEITAFASVKLSAHGIAALPEFETAIEGFHEVVACFVMTGDVDYLLQVVTRDIRSYENFLRNRLLQLATVREVHSQIALNELKHTTRLPLFDGEREVSA